MLWFVIYYVAVVLYSIILIVLKRPSAFLQFLILVSVPFAGVLLVAALVWKGRDATALPEWLIRREQVPETDWLIPDKEKEKNIVPFADALYLNSSVLRRQLLIDMLKKQQHVRQDVLKQALQNDDSETAHYAAVAIQKSKSDTMRAIQKLEERVKESPEDIVLFYELKNELLSAIELEFIDEVTQYQLRQRYIQVLREIVAIAPTRDFKIYQEIVVQKELLGEVDEELDQLSENVHTYFPGTEEAYLLSMKIAYLRKNQTMLQSVLSNLRASSIQLSPAGLEKLRFWM
ncbi:hypothetical protein CQS04_06265 [Chryseomicrobium excrementi]|uniref:Uncharacterized protein n=1 Tax=Chryseomicrobium excrementi TaxID=2041346 RepID=A0A2M9EZX5_9BACL|nr:hypothetical protein [Chryseomicrobium excrementi]PJK16754.1 hypothetical protein CQS04_06265 [Chryseomicrobium excrementi]